MRALVIFLLVLNAVLFLAASQRPPPPPPAAEINPESLRQLSEAGIRPDSRGCLQIGPFADPATRQAAQTQLAKAGIEAQPLDGQIPSYRTLEIYLGPFSSPIAAQSTGDRLRALGLEHELAELASGQVTLILGFFTQASLVEQFIRYYIVRGLPVQTRTRYRPLQEGYWLKAKKTKGVLELLPGVGRQETGCAEEEEEEEPPLAEV